MNLTITGNKVTINNNEYELPDEVISFMVKKFLKMDDVIEENQILKDKVQDLQADYGTQVQMKNQQEKFIKYLEDSIKVAENTIESLNDCRIPYSKCKEIISKEILSKYKSIIGNNSDVTR